MFWLIGALLRNQKIKKPKRKPVKSSQLVSCLKKESDFQKIEMEFNNIWGLRLLPKKNSISYYWGA